MNNEIREILNRLDYNEWDVDLYKVPITWCELYDIRDYITTLQQENERLKEELKYTIPDVQHNQIVTKLAKEKNDYKTRCEKAIDKLKRDYYINEHEWNDRIINEVLNILQNGGKE